MRYTGHMAGLALVIALGALGEAHAQQQAQGEGRHGSTGHAMQGMMGMGPGDMAGRFGEADADGDGKLSRDEMVARMTERAAGRIEARADRMIAHHDADDDGMLTLEEMQSGMGGRMFDRLDADGDGTVSREEFAKMREMRGMMKRGRGMHHGARHGKDRRGTGRGSMGQGGVVIHHHYYGD